MHRLFSHPVENMTHTNEKNDIFAWKFLLPMGLSRIFSIFPSFLYNLRQTLVRYRNATRIFLLPIELWVIDSRCEVKKILRESFFMTPNPMCDFWGLRKTGQSYSNWILVSSESHKCWKGEVIVEWNRKYFANRSLYSDWSFQFKIGIRQWVRS